MADPRQLAGLIGPSMVAIGITEAMNIGAFADQIAPVVYLDGTILFVVGLAIVRVHGLWGRGWPVIMTLTGWVAMLGGLWRMAVPDAPQAAESWLTYLLFAAIAAIGAILSVKAYGPESASERDPPDV